MTDPRFTPETDPEYAGWMRWELRDPTRFNSFLGRMLVRLEEDGQARVRMFPAYVHSNFSNNLHGGAALAFMDVAIFAAARMFGLISAGTAVTVDLSAQFLGAGRIEEPLDAVVELLRETRRLLFLRGLLVQGEDRIAAFSATIRKPAQK